MEVIPAVGIKGGRCVRLVRGDFRRETVYSDSPAEVAQRWESLGAARIHVVDLDGAVAGEPVNLPVIKEIRRRVSVPLQLGGGIRSQEAVERLLGLGIDRVILGTVAVVRSDLAADLCRRYGDRIAVGIDAGKGVVWIKGWKERSGLRATEMARRMAGLGVKRLIYTDISRDGTLTEPHFDAISEMASQTGLPIIASGGVASVADLERLAGMGVEGAIVGKALYTGNVDLAEALAAVQRLAAKGIKGEGK